MELDWQGEVESGEVMVVKEPVFLRSLCVLSFRALVVLLKKTFDGNGGGGVRLSLGFSKAFFFSLEHWIILDRQDSISITSDGSLGSNCEFEFKQGLSGAKLELVESMMFADLRFGERLLRL